MSKQSFSTGHIEYLEKDFLDNLGGKIDISSLNISELGEFRFLKINGISDFCGLYKEKIISLRFFMKDIISGLYEGSMRSQDIPSPLAFAEGLFYLKRGKIFNNFIIFLYSKGFKYKI